MKVLSAGVSPPLINPLRASPPHPTLNPLSPTVLLHPVHLYSQAISWPLR